MIDRVWTLVIDAHCVTIQELAKDVGISTGSEYFHFHRGIGHAKSVIEIRAETAHA